MESRENPTDIEMKSVMYDAVSKDGVWGVLFGADNLIRELHVTSRVPFSGREGLRAVQQAAIWRGYGEFVKWMQSEGKPNDAGFTQSGKSIVDGLVLEHVAVKDGSVIAVMKWVPKAPESKHRLPKLSISVSERSLTSSSGATSSEEFAETIHVNGVLVFQFQISSLGSTVLQVYYEDGKPWLEETRKDKKGRLVIWDTKGNKKTYRE
jgi:hypothetical protein